MDILAEKASNLFFPKTSLLFVYFEAVANSLDAGASKIDIEISIQKFNDVGSLSIKISDNGKGFDNENYKRFTEILNTADKAHKGIGRLVFLQYFNIVRISSRYGDKERNFVFDKTFFKKDLPEQSLDKTYPNRTELFFESYKKDKVQSYDYLKPAELKNELIAHFYPKLFLLKKAGRNVEISIMLNVAEENREKGFVSSQTSFDLNEIRDLQEDEYSLSDDLFKGYKLLYSIEECPDEESSIISALCSDDRAIQCDVISRNQIPLGYKMIFLLQSADFDGNANPSRETLDVDDSVKKKTRNIFSKMIIKIINGRIPSQKQKSEKVSVDLKQKYPHLIGYIDEISAGYVENAVVVSNAQEKFLADQKKLLEATNLTDEQYEKSLDVASRVLTEYVLYRTKIIEKLKDVKKENKEEEIHNLLIPMKKIFYDGNAQNDLYLNNIWVLDDKYMSYSKIISDKEFEKIYDEIHVESSHAFDESKKDDGRPDITIVMSDDPECAGKIDVVIVELKRLGIGLAKKEEVISQIKQRARRLMEFYPDKIQRIWFYGIVDLDKEFIASLRELGYNKLMMTGNVYYKRDNVLINVDEDDVDSEKNTRKIDVFIMEYQTLLNDAEKRNSTFLNLLKNSIQNFIQNPN